MGGVESNSVENVKCDKEIFVSILNVISDAHEVTLYYGELLLQDSLPVVLSQYVNYNKDTEVYFNKTRKEKIEDIDMSYHDFYNQLAYLNYLYERPINNGDMRRKIILQVFDKSYKIQKHLIQDLYNACGNGGW